MLCVQPSEDRKESQQAQSGACTWGYYAPPEILITTFSQKVFRPEFLGLDCSHMYGLYKTVRKDILTLIKTLPN